MVVQLKNIGKNKVNKILLFNNIYNKYIINILFFKREIKMNFILSAITIFSLSICAANNKDFIKEDLTVKKPTNSKVQSKVIYKKVPTKWVKITKNSN
jgi:hypothetical protein